MAIFAVSFLSQIATGKLAAPNEQKIKPIESISIFSVHFTPNLPQASQLLGMTTGRAALTSAAVTERWTERPQVIRDFHFLGPIATAFLLPPTHRVVILARGPTARG
jgi:hypothetical protein